MGDTPIQLTTYRISYDVWGTASLISTIGNKDNRIGVIVSGEVRMEKHACTIIWTVIGGERYTARHP